MATDVKMDWLNEKTLLRSTGQPINGVVCLYNGNVRIVAPYKDGKIEGIARQYYESGKLKEETFHKNDKAEGIQKIYYESGKLAIERPYKNDKAEGYAQVYTENGRLLMKVLYNNDEPVSGVCGNGRVLTNAELINLGNGHDVFCTQ